MTDLTDAMAEILRLRGALLWIACTPTGIPGHAVAVGCPHTREAADVLGVTGMTLEDALSTLNLRIDEEVKTGLLELYDAHLNSIRERLGWSATKTEGDSTTTDTPDNRKGD